MFFKSKIHGTASPKDDPYLRGHQVLLDCPFLSPVETGDTQRGSGQGLFGAARGPGGASKREHAGYSARHPQFVLRAKECACATGGCFLRAQTFKT